jgi:hypothetical protein
MTVENYFYARGGLDCLETVWRKHRDESDIVRDDTRSSTFTSECVHPRTLYSTSLITFGRVSASLAGSN